MLQIREDGLFAEMNNLPTQEEVPDVKTVKKESSKPDSRGITEKFKSSKALARSGTKRMIMKISMQSSA